MAAGIGAALAPGDAAPPPGFPAWKVELWRHALSTGHAGVSLLQAYLFLHTRAEGHEAQALDHLDRATDYIAANAAEESLYYGFPGVGWATAHLGGKLYADDPEDGIELDESLLEALRDPDRVPEYDLIHGLVGLGVFALERLPRPSAGRLLDRVVGRLGERAALDGEGAAFFTPADRILSFYRSSYPRGAYNLGMAHGLAGVVAFLGAVCAARQDGASPARSLLGEAVRWLLARELPPDRGFRFPHFHAPGQEPQASRLAWCYGDLGISLALLVAARGAGEPAWEREAVRIALAAAGREPAATRIADAELCHGASGAGHLFNRLYQASGEEGLAEAARFWIRRALEMHDPSVGLGGFSRLGHGAKGGDEWAAEPGLLIGSAGIGLALLAAASPVPPEWDRVLLLSLRPGPA